MRNDTNQFKSNLNTYFPDISNVLDISKYIHPSDGFLGVNVKWYYPKFHDFMYGKEEDTGQKLIDTFWYKANEIAINYGYASCYKYGRNDGWAVPMRMTISKEFNTVEPLKYSQDSEINLTYLIQLKVFTMFANDIKCLFNLIDKEMPNVKTTDELNQLIDRVWDL